MKKIGFIIASLLIIAFTSNASQITKKSATNNNETSISQLDNSNYECPPECQKPCCKKDSVQKCTPECQKACCKKDGKKSCCKKDDAKKGCCKKNDTDKKACCKKDEKKPCCKKATTDSTAVETKE